MSITNNQKLIDITPEYLQIDYNNLTEPSGTLPSNINNTRIIDAVTPNLIDYQKDLLPSTHPNYKYIPENTSQNIYDYTNSYDLKTNQLDNTTLLCDYTNYTNSVGNDIKSNTNIQEENLVQYNELQDNSIIRRKRGRPKGSRNKRLASGVLTKGEYKSSRQEKKFKMPANLILSDLCSPLCQKLIDPTYQDQHFLHQDILNPQYQLPSYFANSPRYDIESHSPGILPTLQDNSECQAFSPMTRPFTKEIYPTAESHYEQWDGQYLQQSPTQIFPPVSHKSSESSSHIYLSPASTVQHSPNIPTTDITQYRLSLGNQNKISSCERCVICGKTGLTSATTFICSRRTCQRLFCFNCVSLSAQNSNGASVINQHLNECIVCVYQSRRKSISEASQWHFDFRDEIDAQFVRVLRDLLPMGYGLFIEVNRTRQPCWRRKLRNGARKHFSFRFYGGILESRLEALEIGMGFHSHSRRQLNEYDPHTKYDKSKQNLVLSPKQPVSHIPVATMINYMMSPHQLVRGNETASLEQYDQDAKTQYISHDNFLKPDVPSEFSPEFRADFQKFDASSHVQHNNFCTTPTNEHLNLNQHYLSQQQQPPSSPQQSQSQPQSQSQSQPQPQPQPQQYSINDDLNRSSQIFNKPDSLDLNPKDEYWNDYYKGYNYYTSQYNRPSFSVELVGEPIIMNNLELNKNESPPTNINYSSSPQLIYC